MNPRTPISAASDRARTWRTKNEAAYQILRDRILSGDLLPGHEIDHESLAAQLEVSTTPLREAVRRLQTERLIESAQHQKVRVSRLTARELNELYAVRLNLEPMAAELCAQNAPSRQLSHIQEVVSRRPIDGDGLEDVNRELHTAIFRSSGNDVLIRLLDDLWDHADRYRRVLAARPMTAALAHLEHEAHQAVVAAIVEHDVEGAGRAMRSHLLQSIDEVAHLIDQMEPD